MKSLPDTLRLCRLSLPGTHDSGALHGGPDLQTQSTDLSAQLQQGIRVFDIRLQGCEGKLAVYHGTAFQQLYWEDDVLPVFIRFLQTHPSETLIVSLKREGGAPQDYASLLSASLRASAYRDFWVEYFRPDLTLGECRGKILFLHRDPAMKHYPGAACEGWADDATCTLSLHARNGLVAHALLQDEYQYASAEEAPHKLAVCLAHLRAVAAEPSGSRRWGISFVSATGLPQGTPRAFADRLNAPLLDALKQDNLRPCGIVFMDFVGLPAGRHLVEYVINCNF